MTEEWLKNLKPGEHVAVREGGGSYRIDVIKKILPSGGIVTFHKYGEREIETR